MQSYLLKQLIGHPNFFVILVGKYYSLFLSKQFLQEFLYSYTLVYHI